jgi:NitT/TauT family transport system permease protein
MSLPMLDDLRTSAGQARSAAVSTILVTLSWRWPRSSQIEVASLTAGLVLWEVLGRLTGLTWLPPFSAAVASTIELIQRGLIAPNLLDSLQALVIGFVASLGVALVVGFLMAEFKLVERALGPYVYALFLLPSIALAPVFLALFGLSNTTRLAVIFMYGVDYMTLNFHAAFSPRDEALREMARAMGASRWQITRYVTIPGSMPLLLATIRVGLSRAVKGMINGEQFIALYGLGGLVQQFGSQFAADKVFGVILVIAALAVALDAAVRWLDRRWTPWAAQ